MLEMGIPRKLSEVSTANLDLDIPRDRNAV